MPEHSSAQRLDSEMRRIAHGLVAEAPSAPARPPIGAAAQAGPRGNRERRWLRRYVPASAAATVALTSAVGALILANGWLGSTGVDPAAVAAADRRLILESGPAELLPDGSVVPLEIGGLFPVGLTGPPRPLHSGRLVVVGERYPSVDPAAQRAHHLVVVDADGGVEIERVVGSGSEWVSLLATTPDEAILARYGRDGAGQASGPGRIVAHDLATGQVRTIADPGPTQGGLNGMRADVVDDRLVLVPYHTNDNGCRVDVIDLTSGARSQPGALPGCSEVMGVRVSPGGAFVAVTYVDLSLTIKLRLGIVDLASGLVLDDVFLGAPALCTDSSCQGDARRVSYLGMAWDNDTTVRVALLDLSKHPAGNWGGNPIPSGVVLVDTVPVG